MIQHLERVQAQLEPADRRRKIWLNVWIRTSGTNLVCLCIVAWNYTQIHVDLDWFLLFRVSWTVASKHNSLVHVTIVFILREFEWIWVANLESAVF